MSIFEFAARIGMARLGVARRGEARQGNAREGVINPPQFSKNSAPRNHTFSKPLKLI